MGTVPVDKQSQTTAQPAPQHLSDDGPTARADENKSRQRAHGITTSTPSHERAPRDLEEGEAGVPVEAHEDTEKGEMNFINPVTKSERTHLKRTLSTKLSPP